MGMTRVTCMIRPHKLEEVKTAIASQGVTGMTVSDVRGRGTSPERPTLFAGQEMLVALPIRAKIMVVVADELVEPVVQAILESAHTGEPGDGKIFLEPVEDALRIRTLERGAEGV